MPTEVCLPLGAAMLLVALCIVLTATTFFMAHIADKYKAIARGMENGGER
jgi:hypothetical protein